MNAGVRRLLGSTVGLLPTRIRRGVAKGARWTLFPWSSYWRGSYEPAVQRALCDLGQGDIRGWSCWDLGAHFGFYSTALALRVGPTGQVAAFEPNPLSFERLERHRRMNGFDWMKAYPLAASDQTGFSELLTYGDLATTSTHLKYDGEGSSESSMPLAIRTLRLDELVERGELRPPQFVKIDVEGHGHRALEGMKRAVAGSRPSIIVAFHSQPEVSGVLGILEPMGYHWKPIVEPLSRPESMIDGDYLFSP
jgi:FkbM family methyltransferase